MQKDLRTIKSRAILVIIMFAILPLLLSGCMMWMHGPDHGASSQKQQPEKTVVKEFAEKDVYLSLDVPPLTPGDEATLVLRAGRVRSGAPITGAKATFLFEQGEQPVEGHAGHHGKAAVEREAEEISGKGMYQLRHTFEEQGLYRIAARVWIGEKEEAPLTITLAREAARHEGHGAEQSVSPWVVVGGIGMAVMMLFMAL